MKKTKIIISIVILIILIPILFVSGVIIIDSIANPEEIPSFFGLKPFIVLSGSMESEIYAGDIAVVKEVDTNTLKKGDIIAFKSDDVVVTHRIVEITEKDGEIEYVTKGDNNNTEDNGYVKASDVEGLYQFKISRLGNLAMYIQTPTGMIVALSIPILLFIIIQIVDSKKQRKYMEKEYLAQKNMADEIEKLKKQNEELKNKNN